jgi:cytochrome c oxidase subunit 2
MIGEVIVMTPQAYEAWLAGGTGGPAVPPAQAGEKLFAENACVTCHSGQPGAIGPALGGVFGSERRLADGRTVTADDNYLRESIMVPLAKVVNGFQPVMPPFQGRISEEQLMQLIAYVKTLKPAAPAAQ